MRPDSSIYVVQRIIERTSRNTTSSDFPPTTLHCPAARPAHAREAAPTAKRHVHVRANRGRAAQCTRNMYPFAKYAYCLSAYGMPMHATHSWEVFAGSESAEPRQPGSLRSESPLGQLSSCPCPARAETSLDVSAVRVLFRCSCANQRPRESGIRAAVSAPSKSCDVVRCSCCANTFQSAVAPSDDRICTESSPHPESPSMLCS
jgi:hypothetical protein